ncbi:hypothetical protein JX266_003665 [Neoarthrinium moseri]|nr:hypothetical protein JX266_003665 [Neoarthrinium moseri]
MANTWRIWLPRQLSPASTTLRPRSGCPDAGNASASKRPAQQPTPKSPSLARSYTPNYRPGHEHSTKPHDDNPTAAARDAAAHGYNADRGLASTMFQRFKSAIDRTIAEEQARQKAASDQPTPSGTRPRSVSRTNSAKDSPAKRRPKKPAQDVSNGDGLPNPDPAVFEAAFALDEEEAEAKETDEKPAVAQDDATTAEKADGLATDDAESNGDRVDKPAKSPEAAGPAVSTAQPAASAELPAEVKAKLRKLDKLEKTYPELLRSYRIAHGRATSIEPFERALRENTPLTSIKDPAALLEYLNQLNLKGDMVMDEFKRVSAEKESFKKKYEDADKELVQLRDELATLKAARSEASPSQVAGAGETKAEDEPKEPASPSAAQPADDKTKSPDAGKDESEDMFSYEDEIPQLQAEVASKAEEIAQLKSEIGNLKEELSVAKEHSAGLVENLEVATRELSEVRDKSAVQGSLQTQLDARNTEIQTLTEKIEQLTSQLRDVESSLEKERTTSAETTKQNKSAIKAAEDEKAEQQSKFKELAQAKSNLETKIVGLTSEIESLKKSKTESLEKIEQLNKQIQDAPPPSPATTAAPSESLEVPPTPSTTGASKKKNNKKKKKGGASSAAGASTPTAASEQPPPSPAELPETASLREELTKLKDEISQKNTQIDRLSKQRKTEEDLREEIETIQETLLSIGHDHTDAKDKIKQLESERASLKERIAELEAEVASFTSNTEASSKLQSELDTMKSEFDALKAKSQTLTSDLGAAQQLAQSRYKDLTDLREVLSKAQPELKSLRQDSAALKTTREELATKQTEIRNLEKREKELKMEVARVQRIAADREGDIRNLNDRIAAEGKTRAKLEDEKRVAGRDFRRSEAEKIELSAKAEKAARELESLQSELAGVKPKIKTLEDQVEALQRERDSLKEEADLKTAQYNSAQGLMGSMRDQTAELSVQLKEARGQAESLEEELAEVQKHLQERTREGETMRRMVNEVDSRADAKVREMRARLDAAVEERDRIEDEASTLGRRRARESEDLKAKVRELERDVKTLGSEKDDLEAREREWRRRREELEQVEQKANAEVEDMRTAVANLRSALDSSEVQVREAEKQKGDLRKLLDEARSRYEKLNKELRTAQGRLAGGSASNLAGSGRSSIDSSRSGTPINGGAAAPAGQPAVDTMYLKTILLQFLEVKDEKVRSQLVPVLGKLLRFDRSDEQKWINAVHSLAKSGR